jgi:hypothetical protein
MKKCGMSRKFTIDSDGVLRFHKGKAEHRDKDLWAINYYYTIYKSTGYLYCKNDMYHRLRYPAMIVPGHLEIQYHYGKQK